jgi:UDP-glucose 4-epimerase
MRHILVTGATGKVGSHFIRTVFESAGYEDVIVRALCHNRELVPRDRLQVIKGSISDRDTVRMAVHGVTHVVHCATCKEAPDSVMDVTVKGLFWLLEECRSSASFQRFVLIGGDAAMGHFFYRRATPITEYDRHTAYPGCYALSKVLEEAMLEQYFVQYGLNGCCLRAPWIMEKDDFRYSLSFGEDVFGGPRWRDLVGAERADEYVMSGAIPLMLNPDGKAVKRNFVHISDLVSAIMLALDHPGAWQQTFNICMDEPVDYADVAEYLRSTRGVPAIEIATPHWSTWLDNSKAKFVLGWRTRYDFKRLVEEAWSWQRLASDPRRIWYPG